MALRSTIAHEVLGAPRRASFAELRRAYRLRRLERLAKEDDNPQALRRIRRAWALVAIKRHLALQRCSSCTHDGSEDHQCSSIGDSRGPCHRRSNRHTAAQQHPSAGSITKMRRFVGSAMPESSDNQQKRRRLATATIPAFSTEGTETGEKRGLPGCAPGKGATTLPAGPSAMLLALTACSTEVTNSSSAAPSGARRRSRWRSGVLGTQCTGEPPSSGYTQAEPKTTGTAPRHSDSRSHTSNLPPTLLGNDGLASLAATIRAAPAEERRSLVIALPEATRRALKEHLIATGVPSPVMRPATSPQMAALPPMAAVALGPQADPRSSPCAGPAKPVEAARIAYGSSPTSQPQPSPKASARLAAALENADFSLPDALPSLVREVPRTERGEILEAVREMGAFLQRLLVAPDVASIVTMLHEVPKAERRVLIQALPIATQDALQEHMLSQNRSTKPAAAAMKGIAALGITSFMPVTDSADSF